MSHIVVYLRTSISLSELNALQMALHGVLDHVIQRLILVAKRAITKLKNYKMFQQKQQLFFQNTPFVSVAVSK